jgi:hypothetical protein
MGIYEKFANMGEKLDKRVISIMGALGLTALIVSGTTVIAKRYFSPKQVIEQPKVDFNCDGIQDILVEQGNGNRIPMYGYNEGNVTIYVTASEMKKRNPSTKFDYESIEIDQNETWNK